MTKSKLITAAALVTTLGLSMALLSAPVSAERGGINNGPKGPQGSLGAATVCEIVDTTTFRVTIRLTDKSSGSGESVVTSATVDALAKTKGNWNNIVAFDTQSGAVNGLNDIVVDFDLCDSSVTTKAVNAEALIVYTAKEGAEPRNIENRCSDDLDTIDVVEPAGIKLSPDDLMAINTACGR